MSCEKTSIGVSISEEDMKFYSELISKIVTEYIEEVVAACEQLGESMANAFGYAFQDCIEACDKLKDFLNGIEECGVENTGTPPKKYGMSLHKYPRRTSVHYNYIPTAPRNLPYMRRAY